MQSPWEDEKPTDPGTPERGLELDVRKFAMLAGKLDAFERKALLEMAAAWSRCSTENRVLLRATARALAIASPLV
jgi:hypothetical protein